MGSENNVIWDSEELKRECERRIMAPAALSAVADYTRRNSALFVRSGPRMLTPAETARRRQRIEALADKLDDLAESAGSGLVEYRQFERQCSANVTRRDFSQRPR